MTMSGGTTPQSANQPRNLVLCMDGTGNRPKPWGNSNVLRIYSMAESSDSQLTFYSQGVGTRADPAALTGISKRFTKWWGLASGNGMRRDVADAYRFLVEHYRSGDHIYVFGFSRGGFAALALVGLLRLYGIVREDADNMIEEVVDRASRPKRKSQEIGAYKFRGMFARRIDKEHRIAPRNFWAPPVHFLGLFDVVKALHYFKPITRFKEDATCRYHPTWPFTWRPENVRTIRHAVSIDDRRFPYDVYGVRPAPPVDEPGDGTDFDEVWFAGVHSDVGGAFEDLSDRFRLPPPTGRGGSLGRITLKWMLDAALSSGLVLEDGEYTEDCRVVKTVQQKDETGTVIGEVETVDSAAKAHSNGPLWRPFGLARRLERRASRRRFLDRPIWRWPAKLDDEPIRFHQSVYDREGTRNDPEVETQLPQYVGDWHLKAVEVADPDWKVPRPDDGHLDEGLGPRGPREEDLDASGRSRRWNYVVSTTLLAVVFVAIGGALIAALEHASSGVWDHGLRVLLVGGVLAAWAAIWFVPLGLGARRWVKLAAAAVAAGVAILVWPAFTDLIEDHVPIDAEAQWVFWAAAGAAALALDGVLVAIANLVRRDPCAPGRLTSIEGPSEVVVGERVRIKVTWAPGKLGIDARSRSGATIDQVVDEFGMADFEYTPTREGEDSIAFALDGYWFGRRHRMTVRDSE